SKVWSPAGDGGIPADVCHSPLAPARHRERTEPGSVLSMKSGLRTAAIRRPWDGAVIAVMLAAMLQASVAAAGEVPPTGEGGVYLAPVTIEGRLQRPFIVDSGASDVQVSAELFELLYPRGTPPPRFLAGGSYRLADGRVVSGRRFVIRSLRVG